MGTLSPTLAISQPIDLENKYRPSKTSIIATTNNAVEQVIRVPTHHHKTFGAFESVETARIYAAVFEKIYRFTPFSDHARERTRSKYPLELARYDIQELPWAQLFREIALQWPPFAFRDLVPGVRRSPQPALSWTSIGGIIGSSEGP